MANRNMRTKTVADSLSTILKTKAFLNTIWDMVDKLLLEKIQIAGISRVTGISEPWLQRYINRKYARVPHAIDRSKKGHLTVDV